MTTWSASSSSRVVVVGASLAGLRTAEALRKAGYAGQLTVVGEEIHRPYDRPPLSKTVLAGATAPAETQLPTSTELGAQWLLGRRAVGADLLTRRLELDDDTTLDFDGLVIATGSSPRRLPADTCGNPRGVHLLRTLDDGHTLRQALQAGPRRVAVIGAGFIGTEVAASARGLDLDVTLIDAAPLPLLGAVGFTVGGYVADLHRRHGVDLRMGAMVTGLETSDDRLAAVRLDDATAVKADLAVVGLGTVPNTCWLTGSGALLDAGVRTDAALRVLDTGGHVLPGIVAAGDIVRWPHALFDDELVRVEHWSNATDHARVAARSLLAHLTDTPADTAAAHDPGTAGAGGYAGVPSFWSDQYGAKLMSVGLPHLADDTAVLDSSLDQERFVVGYARRGRMVGAVALNQPRRLSAYRRHIAARGPWPPPPPEGHRTRPAPTPETARR